MWHQIILMSHRMLAMYIFIFVMITWLKIMLSVHYIGKILHQESIILSSFVVSPARGSPVCLPSQRGIHEKDASTQKCFHKNVSATAVTAHTILLLAEWVIHEASCLKVIRRYSWVREVTLYSLENLPPNIGGGISSFMQTPCAPKRKVRIIRNDCCWCFLIRTIVDVVVFPQLHPVEVISLALLKNLIWSRSTEGLHDNWPIGVTSHKKSRLCNRCSTKLKCSILK